MGPVTGQAIASRIEEDIRNNIAMAQSWMSQLLNAPFQAATQFTKRMDEVRGDISQGGFPLPPLPPPPWVQPTRGNVQQPQAPPFPFPFPPPLAPGQPFPAFPQLPPLPGVQGNVTGDHNTGQQLGDVFGNRFGRRGG